ncbi:MAG: hypothetical protein A2W90_18120 [Bacteroidetes bacterium GWF2_42_66]|nr:MAG: hypothetical protein A2W92_06110 [Bacteroidetes bacterium GWA2_42_15]OFX98169.1 MAG: hypothetical protein A2W89_09610 [Bacteroidetes bacterium GWE2_42_39]OFY42554.1 MAG: hypothetical protein A2W90_18120 [Bacteroidetes bacterium GWF2_42_66]HBL74270.1 hypothetical protein [Prolixibacteraceae bacterium]HCU64039.1 hypothetical protein [Prolixibacteraceae bacterium]
MENKHSQNQQIRAHLEAGKSITPLEALRKFNCLRLGARIYNLKGIGLPISSKIVSRNGKHFAEYSLQTPSELHARDRYAVAQKITITPPLEGQGGGLFNHELWHHCRRCGKWFDRHLHGDECPDCGYNVNAMP